MTILAVQDIAVSRPMDTELERVAQTEWTNRLAASLHAQHSSVEGRASAVQIDSPAVILVKCSAVV